MTLKLTDTQNRAILNEGRNYGVGFAFAKRTDKNTLETVDPISPCKDYLNDRVFTEATGEPFQACGLKTTPQNIFDGELAYLVMAVCKQGRNLVEYANYKRDYQALNDNYANAQKLINWFEDALKLKNKTKILKIKENSFVCVLPKFWAEMTYLISLYSLIIRMGIFYDGKALPFDFFTNYSQESGDKYYMNTVIRKMKMMIGGFIPKQDMKALILNKTVHGNGIVTFLFNKPVDSVPKTVKI